MSARFVRRAAAVLLLLAVVYVAVTFVQVWAASRRDDAAPADAILVLGAAQYNGRPSPVFQARLDHAAELYHAGLAPLVVVTGGGAPGDATTEARTADSYLQAAGVPAEALRLEVQGRTSYESLAASARFLIAEGVRSVILVSDGWHLARSADIARSVGLEPLGSPSASRCSWAGQLRQMVRETAGLAVGRIIGHRRLDRLAQL